MMLIGRHTFQPYGPVRGQLHHHAGMYRTQRRSPRGGMTSGDEQGDESEFPIS